MKWAVLTVVAVLACANRAHFSPEMIARGDYPPAVTGVSYFDAGVAGLLITRFDTDSLEWIGCLYGDYNPDDGRVSVERYYEPEQLRRLRQAAHADLCPGHALGRVHPHLPDPGELNTCYWHLGDMMSFKAAVNYQGYPYLVEAIICQNPAGQHVIKLWGWGELRMYEEQRGRVPFRAPNESKQS